MLFISSGSIGDAIIATGILGHLMDEYPEAAFTVAAGPASAHLFEQCPRIERVIPLVKQPYNLHWLTLWRETTNTKWDVIIDLRGSVIAHLLYARHRIIFKRPDKTLPKREQLARLLKLETPPPPRLWVNDETRLNARGLLPQGKRIVVLAPKTNSAAKDWPLERFIELASRLYQEDIVFAVMGSGGQHASLQLLFRTLPANRVVDLCGKTDLLTAYAIISQAVLFIGNDSGLLHMAAAAKTPSVGIYGPSNDKTYAPRADTIRIVTAMEFKPGEEEKRDNKYMQMISVDKVEAAVRELGVL